MTEHEPQGPDSDRAKSREERHAERKTRREERRAEREARREERHKWYFGFGDAGAHGDRAEASEVVEQRFEVSGMPRVHVNNVSGETDISVGSPSEVFVRARKRVHGWSEDRARRLLENVEIRMEQDGDEIRVEPRLFQQERGWLDLFRGGRVAVDLDIRVPRETHVEASTVSGELSIAGTRGGVEIRSVSGEVNVSDVHGPMRLRTVSGDVKATGYAGKLEANSVSGDIELEGSRVRTPDVVTVSGDVDIDALLAARTGEGRLKTVSGDIELALGEADVEIEFRTVSGDAEVDVAARIEKEGRRDRRIVVGSGGAPLRVKSVSGDLRLRASREVPLETETAPAMEGQIPMGAPSGPGPEPGGAAREILERVARGELSVDEAAAALDSAARGG